MDHSELDSTVTVCKVEFMEEFTINPKHPAFFCAVVTQAACEYELRPFAARG